MNIGIEYRHNEELGKNREMAAVEYEDEGLWRGPESGSASEGGGSGRPPAGDEPEIPLSA